MKKVEIKKKRQLKLLTVAVTLHRCCSAGMSFISPEAVIRVA